MKVVLCCTYSEAIAVRWGNKGKRIYLLNYSLRESTPVRVLRSFQSFTTLTSHLPDDVKLCT